jgi:hypothetical protein
VTDPHQEVEPLRQQLLNLGTSRRQPKSPSMTPM